MQRTTTVSLKGLRIVKHAVTHNASSYTSNGSGERPAVELYFEKDLGQNGSTIFVSLPKLCDFIVLVNNDKHPTDIDMVHACARATYERELQTRLADGWATGRKVINLCTPSLMGGKLVTTIEVSRFDEIFVCANEGAHVHMWKNGNPIPENEMIFNDGDRIDWDSLVDMLTR